MRKDYITFRSITPAQRAQLLLRQQGIETLLQRTPGYMQEQGCGYCLRSEPGKTAAAVEILERMRLSYSRVYPGGEV